MIVMAQLMVHPSVAITCNVLPAISHRAYPTLDQGGKPTPACCAGAKKLLGATRTQADRRTACKCAKTAAPQLKAGRIWPVAFPESVVSPPAFRSIPTSTVTPFLEVAG
ncbi:putative plant lipid transfer protein/Par allergen [Helianthus annuus]|nr:putative plant lipid transfer protein/Par allergen [Helianthus annuus]